MPSEQDKTRRPWWRPKFSVRTKVIVVTLLCCYVACWWPTKSQGGKDVLQYIMPIESTKSVSAMMPLVIRVDDELTPGEWFPGEEFTWPTEMKRRYYFWCFGFVARLPYERDILPPAASDEHEE